jgi:hypothetical protein
MMLQIQKRKMTAEIACGLSAAGAWIGQIKSKEPTEQK